MRYLLRPTIALCTFALSLALTWVLKVEYPPLYVIKHCFPPIPREYKLIRTNSAQTKDEIPFSTSDYETADGIRINCWTEFYNSPERAQLALQKRIESTKIISREPVLDEKGKQIGEKVLSQHVINHSPQGWTTRLLQIGSELNFTASSSMENVLDFERDHKP